MGCGLSNIHCVVLIFSKFKPTFKELIPAVRNRTMTNLLFTLYLHVLVINYADSLYPDQVRHNVGPDLNPNCLTLFWFSCKYFSKKVDFEKVNHQTTKRNMHLCQINKKRYESELPYQRPDLIEAMEFEIDLTTSTNVHTSFYISVRECLDCEEMT